MMHVNLVTDSIGSIWVYIYGLIAGWGVLVTLIVSSIIFLMIRQLRVERRLRNLENQMVSSQRDYNLTLSQWLK
jgi:uncharacterized protein (DUF58 family)